ncbi:MAG: RNA pseudouridine synthase [Desulforhabdus sp.]|jgi:23S rRNA pseudouridine1911/1915/1917 synthase|nr:RNA pseudouridine synthase [Desulforhabdus sp.]
MDEESLYFFSPQWPVLCLDNHLLGLYKPAGLLVQGDRTEEASLLELGKAWLKARYNKPGRVFLGMVHRLDRPVAGVVLFCRTSKAAGRLSEQFRSGTVGKTYLAVVEGRLTKQQEQLTNFIEREGQNSKVVPQPGNRSQLAKLAYRLLEATPTQSLIEVQLQTGRRHQIRVQLSYIGHPVVGDMRYGASTTLPQRQIALFAKELRIEHPTRKEKIAISSPLPAGWPWALEIPGEEAPPWNWDDLRALIEYP